MLFQEASFENALISFCQELGYTHVDGASDNNNSENSPIFNAEFESSIGRINRGVPIEAIQAAVKKVRYGLTGDLIQRNAQFTDYLQNGVDVSIMQKHQTKSYLIYLVDYNRIDNNSFVVANQWTIVEGNNKKRPDVIIFINGLPLVVMELKTMTTQSVEISDAYLQIQTYKKTIPSLFYYNAFCIISNMVITQAGSLTANESRFMAWKSIDGVSINDKPDYKVLIAGMLERSRLLDIIRNFCMFQKEEKGDVKILSAYHQYFAVRKAEESVLKAIGKSRKGGVFWHTQGSGKSLSMLFLAHLLRSRLSNPTIIVITDRNDLDNQLYSQFAKCSRFLRTDPVKADSRDNLTNLLSNSFFGGIYFTTMQKFEEADSPFSLRDDIIVMTDEAHRGQYGLGETVDIKTGKIHKGAARVIRDALPNATYVGFTGTPIEKKDRVTTEVFGDCIDIYDMTQAVEDGATRPVYYESRVMNLNLDKDSLASIDKLIEDYVADTPVDYMVDAAKTKTNLATMEGLLCAPETIQTLSSDIIFHYEKRQDLLTGKAMIVALSRQMAVLLYQKILELRPEWKEKVKVVMTNSNQDPQEWIPITGNKQYRNELAKKFKDDSDPMKIAIVVDMWLTGFDVPSLATMYICKPMEGYNLMQAIARVNRVFKDKEGGLVVDYVGIATALKEAMKQYSKRDRDNYGDPDILKTAYVEFCDTLELCKASFHGFDLTPFIHGTDFERANVITEGLDFILAKPQNKQEEYMKAAYRLRQAASLCRSVQNSEERLYSSLFEAIRVSIFHLTVSPSTDSGRAIKELTDQVKNLLQQSVHSEGVINLFDGIDTKFSLLDPSFLEEVARMKEKHIAAELLKKLLTDKIRDFKKKNLVQAQAFSEKMEEVLNRWRNSQISNAEVIEELLALAKEIKEQDNVKDALGLSDEEIAFYDALTKSQAVKDFYENEELINMTKELADTLRKNRTIDWNLKEGARANMRRLVKRLLKKYKYPPDDAECAMDDVLKQCELWSESEIA